MSALLDLGGARIVDQHCHPVARGRDLSAPESYAACFTESDEDRTRSRFARSTLAYSRIVSELGEALGLGVGATEAEVVSARAELGDESLIALLLGESGPDELLVDTGYPPAPRFETGDLQRLTGKPVHTVLRLESVFERLIEAGGDLLALRDAMVRELAGVRAAGVVALKTVMAYRGGLTVGRWSEREAVASLEAFRERGGPPRLGAEDRPLLDTLLRDALRVAAAQDLPVQIHTGFGDPSCDLRLADPLLLRGLLHDGGAAGVQLVLLHFSWPYAAQAAHLASLYDGIWLDADFGVPFLSTAGCRDALRTLLSLAPVEKIAYSSDGFVVPDLHWASAALARSVIAEVLGAAAEDGDLTQGQAHAAAERILSGTATELYGL